MLRLYYSPGACSLAVHIVLEWIGQPYEAVRVDPQSASYRAINPAGAVPALDYGAEAPLTQCSALLTFLAESYPEADLAEISSPDRSAQINKWASFLTGDLHPAFFPAFKPDRYTVSKDVSAHADVRAAALVLVRSKLGLLDKQIGENQWIVGQKRTFVDAYAVPMLRWAQSMLPDGLLSVPACAAHLSRMLMDSAVKSAMEAEGLTSGTNRIS